MNSSPGRTEGGKAGPTDERIDEWLRLLADERRRRVLRSVDRHGAMSMDDLVREVEPSTAGERTGVDLTTSLHHVHLPKLSASGLVEFDPERGRVEKAAWPPLVADLVDRLG
jgi:DNA-binding transcriptional ArsR family regulator